MPQVIGHANAASNGSLQALYSRCKRIAQRQLGSFKSSATLSPTALVNEAYLRLAGGGQTPQGEHLVSLWTRTMRHVLIDYCRSRSAQKRSGNAVSIDECQIAEAGDPDALLGFEQQLKAMEQHDARLARVVELRVYAGLDAAATAVELGVDVRTVQRDWLRARAWLASQ